jgi:hypothetical protein
VRDDPRYYPYRYGGRDVVADRPGHPGPRYVFREADPRLPAASRGESARRPDDEDAGRTSEDVGGRGAVPAPGVSLRRRGREPVSELSPAQPSSEDRRRGGDRRDSAAGERPRARERDDSAREFPEGLRPTSGTPRSTGEPELRRRKP